MKILGCEIHVEASGHGAPLLLLHGNPDSSRLWRGVMAALPQRRCIAPDLPGYGRSTAPPDFDYTLDGQAAFVNALLDALGLDGPVDVVGHDFGAIFALAWLAAHPRRARRVVVSNTAFFADWRWHFFARLWRRRGLGELSMALMNRWSLARVYRRGSLAIDDGFIDETWRALTPAVRRQVLRLYRAVPPAAFEGWTERLHAAAREVPLLVLWGDGDPFVPDAFADRFGARRVVRFAAAGHWLPAVQPQAFAREVSNFAG